MKKVFLLFSLFLMLSCSNSDDNNNLSNSDFNPPNWIQGTWTQESEIGLDGGTFTFTSNDFCLSTSGVDQQCQRELIEQLRQSGVNPSVIEYITDDAYTIEINYGLGQSSIYSFEKLSSNSIEWTAVPGAVFTKQ